MNYLCNNSVEEENRKIPQRKRSRGGEEKRGIEERLGRERAI